MAVDASQAHAPFPEPREACKRLGLRHGLYERQKRKMESMRRSMSFMLNRELSRGWVAWRARWSLTRGAFMQKLRKGA